MQKLLNVKKFTDLFAAGVTAVASTSIHMVPVVLQQLVEGSRDGHEYSSIRFGHQYTLAWLYQTNLWDSLVHRILNGCNSNYLWTQLDTPTTNQNNKPVLSEVPQAKMLRAVCSSFGDNIQFSWFVMPLRKIQCANEP